MRAYLDLLKQVDEGEKGKDRTEAFDVTFRHEMREGFPLVTTNHVSFRNVFFFTKWILGGMTFSEYFTNRRINIHQQWDTTPPKGRKRHSETDFGAVYGQQLRDTRGEGEGEDQLAILLNNLAYDPFGAHHVVTYWDLWNYHWLAKQLRHVCWQVVVHPSGELSLKATTRIADAFRDVPNDIAHYGLILTLLGHATARPVRSLSIAYTHLYLEDNVRKAATAQLKRKPHKLPSVVIDARLACKGLSTMDEVEWDDVTLHGYKHAKKLAVPAVTLTL